MKSQETQLGNKIRKIRKRLGISMQQLADMVGVNYSTIHRIETGKVSPSVVLLSEIAYHLGQPITTFLKEERLKIRILRSEEQPEIASSQMSLKLLVPKGAIDERISISLGKGGPGEIIGEHKTPGHEFAYMIRGTCIFTYGGTEYKLNPGDLVYFDGKIPHSVRALELIEFLAIYFRPEP